jgi:hypothetical protein
MSVKLRLRLLGDPGAGRVDCAASEVDAAAFEFDEEEHVEASERDRLDGEEVAGKHGRGLLAEEFPPARTRTPRRWLKTGRQEQTPQHARRNSEAELQQLTCDPPMAPAWVLTCEAQDELSHAILDRRTARRSSRLRPLPSHEFPMPAQKRLRGHDQPSPPTWKHPGKRREERAIGRHE